ncbi:hypothetical protein ebA766 [Aromatoleum aromaticum EbN1]|uniref:Uncharacterized protein n=1 Tax=Aromatoleum aromaticum (strain DSM 19018 / LMG 30748 / EbN1) TaxID=76114 RepID=Q5P845_AROAE|nr:hypothetical protein ebA766 [Aromatoleum aromaticum EbN1]
MVRLLAPGLLAPVEGVTVGEDADSRPRRVSGFHELMLRVLCSFFPLVQPHNPRPELPWLGSALHLLKPSKSGKDGGRDANPHARFPGHGRSCHCRM